MIKFNKILCPVDFSESADNAIAYAVKMADEDSVVELLSIIETPYTTDPMGYTNYYLNVDEIKAAMETKMQEKIEELKLKYPSYHFNAAIDMGLDPAKSILDIIVQHNCDLVLMGSHGRKGLSRILMGSVAESVMREAACPVLIIKK
jgi:universal stress protein A